MLKTVDYLQSLGHKVTEVRILRDTPYLRTNANSRGEFVGKTVFGYYDNEHYDQLWDDIQQYENDPNTKGIYTTIQRCDPALLARSLNRLQTAGDNSTTSDGNITHFCVFPIDVDSDIPSGISATESELEASCAIAKQIATELDKLGVPLVKAKSGNGWHILIYLETLLEVTEDATHRFKRLGDVIVEKWGGDATVYNPARIWKLYGTTAKKGDVGVPDRPHRKAEIFEPTDPAEIKRISFDALEAAILSIAPDDVETPAPEQKPERTPSKKTNGKRLPPLDTRADLEQLAKDCGVVLQGSWVNKTGKNGSRYEAIKTNCPLCSRDKCGVLTYSANGECGYKCHTDTCSGKNLQDLYEKAGYTKAPEKSHGGKREGAGRKSKAEKAASIELPEKMKGKPVISLYEVEDIEGSVIISERSREVVSNDVVKHLWGVSLDVQKVYRRGTELGTLRRGKDTLQFTKLDVDAMQGEVARVCTLVRERDGNPAAVANPPQWLAADILKNQSLDTVSEIKVVMSHPFWNGTEIVSKPGYDHQSRAYLDTEGIDYDMDTETHSAESDLKLFRDLLCDFPFKDESDFENAIGYALTLVIRQGLKTGEAAPLVDITAPREGVGKSLLAETLTGAVIGSQPRTRSLGSTKEEVEKGVGAALRGAPEVVLFDNVDSDKRLDSGILASVVTQPNRAFRILGVSEEMFYENRATIIYTGSNVEVTPELAKRMIAIRLYDTGEAEKDRKVKVEGLLEHAISRHTEFISALLRMVKRWMDAGSVEAPENLHRMRQWSRVIHGIMLANDFGKHFMKNFDDVMLDANPEFTAWANGFKQIVAELGIETATIGFTTADVFEILSHTDNVYAHEDDISDSERSYTRMARGADILGEFIGNARNDKSRSIRLGKLLRSKVGNVYADWELIDTHKSDRNKIKIYALKWRGKPENDPTAADTDESQGTESMGTEESLLSAVNGKPIISLTPESLAEVSGYDPKEIPGIIKDMQDSGKLVKRIHDGAECFFVENDPERGSAEVAEMPF